MFHYFDSSKPLFVAYLCPNMINFHAVDFNERRSEEVMFLLTLSVNISEN